MKREIHQQCSVWIRLKWAATAMTWKRSMRHWTKNISHTEWTMNRKKIRTKKAVVYKCWVNIKKIHYIPPLHSHSEREKKSAIFLSSCSVLHFVSFLCTICVRVAANSFRFFFTRCLFVCAVFAFQFRSFLFCCHLLAFQSSLICLTLSVRCARGKKDTHE